MTISDAYKKAIQDKNVTVIKVSLVECLKNDTSFNMYNEYLDYAIASGIQIFDTHDGEVFLPENQWSDSYIIQESNQMVRNFSKERETVLKKMLRKDTVISEFKIDYQKKEGIKESSNRTINYSMERKHKRKNNKKLILIGGVVVVAVVIGILILK